MNIELVGIPGVGKSYLCRSVEEKILEQKAHPESGSLPLTTPWLASPHSSRLSGTLRKVARASAFASLHPAIVSRLFKVVFGNGQGFQKNRCTKYLNLLAEMQHLHDTNAPTSLLTEQGVLQGVWSLQMLTHETTYDQIMRLIIPWLPDAIVVVVAESSQHEKQLVFRELGQSTFDRLQGEKLYNAIEQGELNLARILELWTELRPDGKRLDFDNEPDNDARELFSWLSSQLS
ncbi:MAG: hypothetical protein AB8B64_22505 [Granulosicoccus sp.]